jgi:hypothetical protein
MWVSLESKHHELENMPENMAAKKTASTHTEFKNNAQK